MDMQTQSWPRWLNKRDDSRVAFDSSKIERAIERAGAATGELGAAQAHILTRAVLPLLPEGPELTVEQIQDCVERVLMEAGYYPTARAYIVYRERHGRLRRERRSLVDVAASMNE